MSVARKFVENTRCSFAGGGGGGGGRGRERLGMRLVPSLGCYSGQRIKGRVGYM